MHVLQSPKRDFFFFFLTQPFAKSQLQSAGSFLFLFFSDIIRELSSSTELEHSKPRSQKWGEKKATRSTLLNNELSRWMEGHIGWNHGIFCKLCIFFSCPFQDLTAAVWHRICCAPLRHRRLIMKRRATPSLVPLTNESGQRWSGSPPATARTSQMKKKKKKKGTR